MQDLKANGGRFIVFEGIDGSGTSTQVQHLANRLRREHRIVHATREPSDGPIGSLLRLALAGRVSFAGTRQSQTMALLFAADRLDHNSSEIERALRDGAVVISDRYDLSSLVYQSATSGPDPAGEQFVQWVQQLNRFALRPDATVVVDVDAAEAERRRREREGAPELYEETDLQRRLAELYRVAEKLVPGDRVLYVDGNGPVEQVSAAAYDALRPML